MGKLRFTYFFEMNNYGNYYSTLKYNKQYCTLKFIIYDGGSSIMFNIYNETGKVLKLHSEVTESGERLFQIGVGNTAEEINDFYTISTIKDANLFEMIEEFCGKCKPITKKTSRFYFRGKDRAVPYYNTRTCEMDAFDVSADASEEDEKKFRNSPRNCLIFVLNPKSTVYMFRKFCAGRLPAKTIQVAEDVKVLIFFTKYNNWAKGDTPTYIYVDGVDGKKQIRAGFTKTGPNKEFTTNTLFEEDFEGEAFPEDPTPKKEYPNKKPFNKNNGGRKFDNNTDRPNPRKKPDPKIVDKFDFSSYGDGIPVNHEKENRRRRKDNKYRNKTNFERY